MYPKENMRVCVCVCVCVTQNDESKKDYYLICVEIVIIFVVDSNELFLREGMPSEVFHCNKYARSSHTREGSVIRKPN